MCAVDLFYYSYPTFNKYPTLGCSDEWPDYCPGYKDKYGCTDVPPINGDGDRWKESVNSVCPKTCDKCGGVEAPGGGGGGKRNLVFTNETDVFRSNSESLV